MWTVVPCVVAVEHRVGGVGDCRRGWGSAGGLGDQTVHHVRQMSTPPQRTSLPGRRTADTDRLVDELGDRLPVAAGLQFRLQHRRQFAHHVLGRTRFGGDHVDEVCLQARSRSLPQRRPIDRGRHLDAGFAVGHGRDLVLHQCPEQAGDERDGVDGGAAVADPEFECRLPRRGPHVVIDHSRVGDDSGVDQALDVGVIVSGGIETEKWAGGGPTLPDECA